MKRCLEAIENGSQTIFEIKQSTGLNQGQVQSAVWNLKFIGVIERGEFRDGRYMYFIQGRGPVAKCLCGVNSIFNVR
jgi:predicted transcriptional regulator